MKFTKRQVMRRAAQLRFRYHAGELTLREIKQYESLTNWTWGNGAYSFLSLKDAQSLCKTRGLDTANTYRAFLRKNKNTGLPSNPNDFYKLSWGIFFGKKSKTFLTLKKAQAFCKREDIDNQKAYWAFLTKHKNTELPHHPNRHYELGWREFFGKTKPVFLSLKGAQSLCKRKGINKHRNYHAYMRKHKNTGLRAYPNVYYAMRWNEFFEKKPFLTLKEAQDFAKKKGLDCQRKYYAFVKAHKNSGLPYGFTQHYKIRIRKFFGTAAPVFLSLEKTQGLCKREGLNSVSKYVAYVKSHKSAGLPSAPNTHYKISWGAFFGKKPNDYNAYSGQPRAFHHIRKLTKIGGGIAAGRRTT